MLKVIFNKMVGVFVLLLFGILCELFDRLINRHAIIKKITHCFVIVGIIFLKKLQILKFTCRCLHACCLKN